jgi:AraC-like DNA-binding protein
MPIIGHGRIIVWEGASLWMFEAEHGLAQTEAHAHHALQITFAISGAFELGSQGHWITSPVAAVAPDTIHIFRHAGIAAHLFVEPESAVGRALSSELFHNGAITSLNTEQVKLSLDSLRKCFSADHGEADLLALGRQIVSALSATVMPTPVDQRVLRMVDFVSTHLDGDVSLPTIASQICLSPSRASHLFVANTGLALKSYVLWRRLERAVGLYARGNSLTVSAHEAGFADSAHLSRTFRRTFGIPAAALRLATG